MVSVNNLRMELQSPDLSALIGRSCDEIPGLSQNPEVLRQLLDTVSVTHPAMKSLRQTLEKGIRLNHVDRGLAKFTPVSAGNHPSTHGLADELQAIADPQHGYSGEK